MSRPKPTVLVEHTNRHTYKTEQVLASEGITDLDKYAVVPGTKEFINDLYVD